MKSGDKIKVIKKGAIDWEGKKDRASEAYKEAKLKYPSGIATVKSVVGEAVKIMGSEVIIHKNHFEVVSTSTPVKEEPQIKEHKTTHEIGDIVKIIGGSIDTDLIGESRTITEVKPGYVKVRGAKGWWNEDSKYLVFVEKGKITPVMEEELKKTIIETLGQIEDIVNRMKKEHGL